MPDLTRLLDDLARIADVCARFDDPDLRRLTYDRLVAALDTPAHVGPYGDRPAWQPVIAPPRAADDTVLIPAYRDAEQAVQRLP